MYVQFKMRFMSFNINYFDLSFFFNFYFISYFCNCHSVARLISINQLVFKANKQLRNINYNLSNNKSNAKVFDIISLTNNYYYFKLNRY